MTKSLIRILITLILFAATWLGFQTIRSHYLLYGEGWQLPAAKLRYPLFPTGLSLLWGKNTFSQCFYAKLNDLGSIQLQFFTYLPHLRTHSVVWQLEEIVESGRAVVVRAGSFRASKPAGFGFSRLQFQPISDSALKLYRLRLSEPDTLRNESVAVVLYSTSDPELVGAQNAGNVTRPRVSLVLGNIGEQPIANIPLTSGTRFSQPFWSDTDLLSSIQLQFVTYGQRQGKYWVHWQVLRDKDSSTVAEGALDTMDLADWGFAELSFPVIERARGQTFRILISTKGYENGQGTVGLPIFHRRREGLVSDATVIDAGGKRVIPEGRAGTMGIYSPALNFQFFNADSEKHLGNDDAVSANIMLGYFPEYARR